MAGLSGAMLLLLLVSTLLLIPFCGSKRLYCNTMGSPFTVENGAGRLQGIRIYKTDAVLTGIQLMYGGTWSDLHGHYGLKMGEFLLDEDEEIIEVEGNCSIICIHSLTIFTNKGRKVTFGKTECHEFRESAPPGQQLRSIFGRDIPFCIGAIGFNWGVI